MINMSNAKLSVIVPIYGVEQYLNRCIQSIVNVNYKNIEIILVDDGSKDGCPAICDSWKKKDNRIKVIHKPNGGLVSARKAGLGIATGEYATYVDGDDWIEPEMYDCLEQYDVDLIVEGFISDNGVTCRKEKNRIAKGYYTDKALANIRRKMMLDDDRKFILYPNVWNKIFRREKLLKFQMEVPNEVTLGEDVAVTYCYLLESQNMVVVDECYYHYIQNPNSMTKIKDIRYLEKSFALFDYLSNYRKELGNQLNAYQCSMVVSGISILLDPRVKVKKLYVKKMVKEYQSRECLDKLVETSQFFCSDKVIRKMIESFKNERIWHTKYWVCVYILRCHLST